MLKYLYSIRLSPKWFTTIDFAIESIITNWNELLPF
jgi:hypothetical protein